MFDPQPFNYETPFNGNAAEAFNVARTALLALGFEILVDSDTEMRAEGPGMHSNRQPELVGVSLLQLMISSSKISATAALGGVARMKTFVYLFPPALVISLYLINLAAGGEMSWLYILFILPWLVIAPLIGSALERKTTRAVERLVRGMAKAKTN